MTFGNSWHNQDLKASHKYVDNFQRYKNENVGLMFIGTNGTGKTYAAAAIANGLTDKGVSVLMANVTWFTAQMQEFNHQAFLNTLRNPDLLIIDDIGAERQKEFMYEQIYTIIETRYQSQKPLVISANITLDEIKTCTDIRQARTFERLKEMCVPIVMAGESFRTKNCKRQIYQNER